MSVISGRAPSCRLSVLLFVTLFAASTAAQRPQTLRGTWIATAGPKQVYRGTWSGEMLPGRPNAAQGSWTVTDGRNKVLLSGTWSAEKLPQQWQGTWSAQVATRLGQTPVGKPISGTWQTELKDSGRTTLKEMLEQTLEQQLAGAWRSGSRSGNWWLTGERR